MASRSTVLAAAGRGAFSNRDRRPIHLWAADHVQLAGSTTINGFFHVAHSRYMLEVFRALQSEECRTICVRAPVRSGKTLIPDVWLPWIIVNDPGPVQWNAQDIDLAKYHAETRVNPVLENCAVVKALLPRSRHKRRNQSIMFAHGMPFVIQGPTLGKLQGRGIRYQINDETWAWEQGRHAQAIARLGDYEELSCSKELNLSQAGIEGDDEDVRFRQGELRQWQVPCLGCGGFFFPEVRTGAKPGAAAAHLTWDEVRGSDGEWKVDACAATVRFVCPSCGYSHTDAAGTRHAWNLRGRYGSVTGEAFQENGKFPPQVSFIWSGVCTRSWDKLAREYLQSLNALRAGVLEPLIAFHQKRLPKPWSEAMLFDSVPVPTYSRDEKWGEEFVRVMTVDRQSQGLHWAMIWAWSKTGRSRRLWFGRLNGEDDVVSKQREFDVQPNHVLIDSGYEAKIVYAMCIRRGWLALKGDDRTAFQWHAKDRAGRMFTILRSYSKPVKGDPEIGKVEQGRRFATLILWSNPTIKSRLQRHMERGHHTDPQASHDDEMELEYKRQMRSEYQKQKVHPVTGQRSMIWVCPSGNNHAFDCSAMEILAATLLKILPDSEVESNRPAVEVSAQASQ